MANQRTTGFNARPRDPVFTHGKKYLTIPARAALVAATMVNGDTVELGGPFTFDQRIARIRTPNASPALTASVANLGFFMRDSTGALQKITPTSDVALWSATTALATAQSARDLLYSINAALDSTKNIGELLGLTSESEPAGGVYLLLTFTTKPSVDGVLDLDIDVQEATTK